MADISTCLECDQPATHFNYEMTTDAYGDPDIKMSSVNLLCPDHAKKYQEQNPSTTTTSFVDAARKLSKRHIDTLARAIRWRGRHGRIEDVPEEEDTSALMQPEVGGLSQAQSEVASIRQENQERDEDGAPSLSALTSIKPAGGRSLKKDEVTDYTKFRWKDPLAHYNAFQTWRANKKREKSRQYAANSRSGIRTITPRNSEDPLVSQFDLKRLQEQLGMEIVDFANKDSNGRPVPVVHSQPVASVQNWGRMEEDITSDRRISAIPEYSSAGGDQNKDFENQPPPFEASHYAPADVDQLPIAKPMSGSQSFPCSAENCNKDATHVVHNGPEIDERLKSKSKRKPPMFEGEVFCKQHAESDAAKEPEKKAIVHMDDSWRQVFGQHFGEGAISSNAQRHSRKVYPIAVKYHPEFGYSQPIAWHEGRAVHVHVAEVGKDEDPDSDTYGKKMYHWIPTNYEPIKSDGTKISAEEMRGLDLYRHHQEVNERIRSRGPGGAAESFATALQGIAKAHGRTSELGDILKSGGKIEAVHVNDRARRALGRQQEEIGGNE
jgi:hypothetical protein